jgi:hypothetical protein
MYDQEELLENLLNTLAGILTDYEEMSGKTVGLLLEINPLKDKLKFEYDGEKLVQLN